MQGKDGGSFRMESSWCCSRSRLGAGRAGLRAEGGPCGTSGSAQVANPDRAGKGDRKRVQEVPSQYSGSTPGGSLGWCARGRGTQAGRKGPPAGKADQVQQHGELAILTAFSSKAGTGCTPGHLRAAKLQTFPRSWAAARNWTKARPQDVSDLAESGSVSRRSPRRRPEPPRECRSHSARLRASTLA